MNPDASNESIAQSGAETCPPARFRPAKGKCIASQSAAERRRIEALQLRSQAARRMARKFKRQDKAAFAQLNELLLASRLNDVLEDIDPRILKDAIETKPEQFFRLATAINAQAAEGLRREKLEFEFEKYRDHVKQQKDKIQAAAGLAGKNGLTPEILAQIEHEANLL